MPNKHRRPRNPPRQHAERLLAILEANLARCRDPQLRGRLERAIASIKQEKKSA
jgi:hypothetical protein